MARIALTHDEVRSVLDRGVATVIRPLARATTRSPDGRILRRDAWATVADRIALVEPYEGDFAILSHEPCEVLPVRPCWDTRGPLWVREE
jgi:hypothetical protein